MKLYYLVFILFFLLTSSFAQTWDKFHEFGVQSISIDTLGNTWVAENNKIKMYDDSIWVSYESPLEITNYSFKTILVSNTNEKWIGVEQSENASDALALKFIDSTWTLYNLSDSISETNFNVVTSISQDSLSNLWFGTYTGAVKYDGENWEHFYKSDGLVSNKILSVACHNNDIYFGTSSGLSRYDGESWSTFTTENTFGSLGSNYVWAITVDIYNNLWIGTSNGITKFDGSTWSKILIENEPVASMITTMTSDNEGRVWAGTPNGYILVENSSASFHSINSGYSTNSIAIDNKNNSWIGVYDMILKYNPNEPLSFDTTPINIDVESLVNDKYFVAINSNSLWKAQIEYFGGCSCNPWIQIDKNEGIGIDTIEILITNHENEEHYAEIIIEEFGSKKKKKITIGNKVNTSICPYTKDRTIVYRSTNNIVILKDENFENIISVDLYSLSGNKIQTFKISGMESYFDISKYNERYFLFAINYKNKVVTHKIIKYAK